MLLSLTSKKVKENKLCHMILKVVSHTRFSVNPHSIAACMSRNSLLETGVKYEV